eukprot:2395662-Pleurochrysis_carterae.AAC.2
MRRSLRAARRTSVEQERTRECERGSTEHEEREERVGCQCACPPPPRAPAAGARARTALRVLERRAHRAHQRARLLVPKGRLDLGLPRHARLAKLGVGERRVRVVPPEEELRQRERVRLHVRLQKLLVQVLVAEQRVVEEGERQLGQRGTYLSGGVTSRM